jgi:PPK2 family polyphosphate:nucleotide phosphotransferase
LHFGLTPNPPSPDFSLLPGENLAHGLAVQASSPARCRALGARSAILLAAPVFPRRSSALQYAALQYADGVPKTINVKPYCVPQGKKVKLAKWPTKVKPVYRSDEDYQAMLAEQVKELSRFQELHYAHNTYSILLIFQAMDAAGKDGAIRHVMSGVNPQGCQVFSFKHPSATELEHDFLWRTTQCLPERGRIGIFNRSYYEEVLIVRVHPEILASQNLPPETLDGNMIWENRYRSIVDFEKHLFRNGTRTVKFFLHLSKEEQRKRFLERIDDPSKNWKFSQADVAERAYWDKYMDAYEQCLSATSTRHAPWYVVPADDKKNARLIIAQAILDTFRGLKMSYPKPDAARRAEILRLRKQLSKQNARSG